MSVDRLLNNTAGIFNHAVRECSAHFVEHKTASGMDKSVQLGIIQAAAILTLADVLQRIDIDSTGISKAIEKGFDVLADRTDKAGEYVEKGLNGVAENIGNVGTLRRRKSQ